MMDKYYCQECAQKRGFPNSITALNYTGTKYQTDKHIKHTQQPTASASPISIYTNSNSQHISGLMTSGLSLGWRVSDGTRYSMAWNAAEEIGTTYFSTGKRSDSGLRIPQYDDPTKIHAYPTASTEIKNARCADCGKCRPT